MKDYMMWLDDRGIATWDNTLEELIIPDGVYVHDEETVLKYQNDTAWHDPGLDEEDYIEDEDADNGILEDDELGDIQQKIDTIGDLLELVFSDGEAADHFRRTIDTDMLTRLWGISKDISLLNEENEHGWSEDEYWFDSDGGLTGDAQNYLHSLDSRGELI